MSQQTEQELVNDGNVPPNTTIEDSSNLSMRGMADSRQTKKCASKSRQSCVAFCTQTFVLAALGFAGVFGYAWWRTQDVGSAWPYMNGQRVFAVPSFVFLGEIAKDSNVEADVRFLNLDSIDHAIVGARKSCSCISTDRFPIVVPARGEALIKVEFRAKTIESSFEHEIGFFMDERQFATVPVRIAGIAR